MTVGEVFDSIQKIKSNAPAFCTNLFPVDSKLQEWINHAQLFSEPRDGALFFLRKDRDFWHLYFCSASPEILRREIADVPALKNAPVVADIVGREDALQNVLNVMESEGFQPYRKLCRMVRMKLSSPPSSSGPNAPVEYASAGDASAILDLLCCSFDRYAEQLPMLYEIETAIGHRQILVAKRDGILAGLLFYENQGLTSTVRYWLVGEAFRTFRLGSALMQQYFAAQQAAKRFLLWVLADNQSAIQKYQHYGYAADGLVDHVLANRIIRA